MCLTLPYHEHAPALALQFTSDPPITVNVPLQLGYPIRSMRLGLSRTASALVLVPEAAMNEDDRAPCEHDKVGTSGQVVTVP